MKQANFSRVTGGGELYHHFRLQRGSEHLAFPVGTSSLAAPRQGLVDMFPLTMIMEWQVKCAREKAEDINVQRKRSQEAVEQTLWNLARKRVQGTEKNLQILLACEGLRAEVKRLKTLGLKSTPS